MRTILAALILSACARYAPFTPTTVSAPADPFNKSVRVLVQRGETIETKDEGAGVIVTGWREGTQMGGTHRLRWTITVASGTVTVASQCEQKIDDPGPGQANDWANCGNQPGDRTGMGKAIADEIAR